MVSPPAEQAIRRQPLEALLDVEHGGMHQRAHLGRDAGGGQDFLLPVAMQVGVGDMDQQLVIGACKSSGAPVSATSLEARPM